MFKVISPLLCLVFLLASAQNHSFAQTSSQSAKTSQNQSKKSSQNSKGNSKSKNNSKKAQKKSQTSSKSKTNKAGQSNQPKQNQSTEPNFVGVDVIKTNTIDQTKAVKGASPDPKSVSNQTKNPDGSKDANNQNVGSAATNPAADDAPESQATTTAPASKYNASDPDSASPGDENISDSQESSDYYNESSEDVLNPFSIESVKRHIHKLTTPEHLKEKHKHEKSAKHEKSKKKVAPPRDPSKTPFTREWNQQHGRRVLAIIGIMLLALFCAPPITRRLVKYMTQGREGSETIKRIGTSTQLSSKFILVLVLLLGLLEVLKEFQIDIGPMLAGAGIFGVALGFAGQNLLKDILAGVLLIVEEQIRVGDFVKLAGISGTVEDISLRKIQLRDFNGNVLYVPNSKVEVVVNMTREFSRYVIDVPVAYKENFNDVVKVLSEIDEDIRKDDEYKKVITEPLTIFGLSHFGTNGYVITVRTTTKPGDQWRVAREYRKRIKEKFDQLGIEIPISKLSIHTGSERQDLAEPVNIEDFKKGSTG